MTICKHLAYYKELIKGDQVLIIIPAAQHHTTHHPKPTITQPSEHHHITPPTSKQQHISRSRQETLGSKSNRENINNREDGMTTNLLQQRRPATTDNLEPQPRIAASTHRYVGSTSDPLPLGQKKLLIHISCFSKEHISH